MKRIVTLLLASGLTLAAAGCSNSSGEAAPPESAQQSGSGRGGRGFDPNRIVPVEVRLAERGSIRRRVTLSGAVEPIRRVGVNSQLAGALLEVFVEEGDHVAADSVLARLDSRELESQLTSAQASLAAATSAMERAEKLRAAQIYTDVEYERDRTALAAAKAQHDQIVTRLGFATVRAPLAGVVTEKRIERGDIVGGQTRLFTIADISTLVVKVNVSELDVTALQVGRSVDVSVDALGERSVQGRIRRVFPAADTISRLVPVEIELIGPNVQYVKPGFLARATFSVAERNNVLMVPASAIFISSGATIVYVVREGAAELQNVRTGMNSDANIEILEGLNEGDSVIVSGNSGLRSGSRVRVVSAALRDSVETGARIAPDSGGDE